MILVAGPPCGGKTTYVGTHAHEADSLLDFDDIIERITGDRYTRTPAAIAQARAEWNERLPNSDWVIWTAPRRGQRGRFQSQWGASIIVVKASLDVCLQRAAADRPQSWQALVQRWFSDWEPSRSGREQIIDTTTEVRGLMSNLRNGHRERAMKQEFKARCQAANAQCWIGRHPIDYNAPPNTPTSFEPDHYHPVKTHPHLAYDINNLRPSCSRCNRSRQANPPPTTPWVQANW